VPASRAAKSRGYHRCKRPREQGADAEARQTAKGRATANCYDITRINESLESVFYEPAVEGAG